MDKSDLVGRHPLSNEFLTNIIIYRKGDVYKRQVLTIGISLLMKIP